MIIAIVMQMNPSFNAVSAMGLSSSLILDFTKQEYKILE